jgi:predicted glycosyl hydrolase (DUF1957 family)
MHVHVCTLSSLNHTSDIKSSLTATDLQLYGLRAYDGPNFTSVLQTAQQNQKASILEFRFINPDS